MDIRVEQMTIRVNVLKLVLIIAVFLMAGCDRGSSDRVPEPEQQTPLRFVDASRGLPSTGLWREGIWFFDMNGDGHMDIVAPPPRKASEKYSGPIAWYGNGKGEWAETRLEVPSDVGFDYGAIVVSDFDGDGIPDIALAMHMMGLRVLKGVGQGKYVDFSGGVPPAGQFLSRALVSADFNNDGAPDIAALSEAQFSMDSPRPKGIWSCYRSDEAWQCGPIEGEDEGGLVFLFGDQIFTGDVNGDGNQDIAAASLAVQNNRIVWLGDGKGGFSPFTEGLPQHVYYLALALGDMDHDGKDDLVASISGIGQEGFLGLKAFLSRPDGFVEVSEGLPDGLFTALGTGDLDGDGALEVVAGTADGGLRVFSWKDGTWHEMEASGLPKNGLQKIYRIYCMDLNKDGLKDIAINYAGKETSGGISVFYNSGTGKKQEGKE
ncbi:MAG: VCBS repeat-containing protein [Deltaproteobacteria bacterium]|nr:VCBS repeat-containing protein [Deltaproteobacteria bacterium]